MKRAVLGLLLLALCLSSGAYAEQYQQFSTIERINLLSLPLKMPVEMNLLNLPKSTTIPPLGYMMILSQGELNYNPLLEGLPNSNSETSELMNMLNLQMENLLNLEIQWQAMEAHYRQLSVYNKELLNLLNESRDTLAQLRKNLEAALERVQDAEEGAIALLDENAEIYQKAKNMVAYIAMLQNQLAKSKKSVIVGFTIGGISFGVGTPLIVEGIRTENSTMAWAGAGVVFGTGTIWAVGHYVFKWW
jgi:hypothetical protein